MQYQHIPEVILKLGECGYSKEFCRGMVLRNSKEVDLKVFFGALRRWPLSAIKVAIPFIALVSLSAFDVMAVKDFKLAEANEPTPQEVRSANNRRSQLKSTIKSK
jgi:hypothetical protein